MMAGSSDLQHGVDEIVAQLLIDQGRASDPVLKQPWPVYIGLLADQPDNSVALTVTTGIDEGRSMVDGEMLTHYAFQAKVRGGDDTVGISYLSLLRTWFMRVLYRQPVWVGGVEYFVVMVSPSQVLKLGRDRPNTGRYICTLNCIVDIMTVTP